MVKMMEKTKKIIAWLESTDSFTAREFKAKFELYPTQAVPKQVKKMFVRTTGGEYIKRDKIKKRIVIKKNQLPTHANPFAMQDLLMNTLVELAQRQERMEKLLIKLVEGKKWAKYWQKKKKGIVIPVIDENGWMETMGKELRQSKAVIKGMLDTLIDDKEIQMNAIYNQFGVDIAKFISVMSHYIEDIEKYCKGTVKVTPFAMKLE